MAALVQERTRSLKLKNALYNEGVPRDILEGFESCIELNGMRGSLFFTCPGHASWSSSLSSFILDLTRSNMSAIYDGADGWGWKEGKKRAELNDDSNRYIMIRYEGSKGEGVVALKPGDIIGFVSFRFLMEADFEALYIYELQFGQHAQGKGFGKHLMNLCDQIAKKFEMN